MDILSIILTSIPSIAGGGLLGFLLERRKRKAETKLIEADVEDKMREMYLKFVEDYEKKYNSISEELEMLRKDYEKLKKENQDLIKMYKVFKNKNK